MPLATLTAAAGPSPESPCPGTRRLTGRRHGLVTLVMVATAVGLAGQAVDRAAPTQATSAPETARTWLGRTAELEAFLRTARVVNVVDVPVGVTKPRRIYFEPGGLAESAAWKPLRPGIYRGHYESYRSEIAAYELDKVLGLDMVPVAVERSYEGQAGAAVLWVGPVKMLDEARGDRVPMVAGRRPLSEQVVRMRMFDALINNTDRNQGNMLIDPSGYLILIDHSRAFVADRRLPRGLDRLEADLWARFDALSQEEVERAVGSWLPRGQWLAILARRDLMREMAASQGLPVR